MTDLSLSWTALSMGRLKTLLMIFPQLRRLGLYFAEHFNVLTFLEPVRSTLRSLSLRQCSQEGLLPGALFFLHD